MIIIFYNLSKAFINGNSPLKFGLVQDFLVGIALTIYLIYIIPNESLQQIIIPIVATVYGGLLTLVGVAWTIKKSDRDRKEEEKKKAKPVFTYNAIFDEPNIKSGIKTCFPEALEENYFSDIYFEIENSNNSHFKIVGIYHDKKWFSLENNTVVLPNSKVVVSFRFNDPKEIFLEVEDELLSPHHYLIQVVSLNHTDKQNAHEVYTIRNLIPTPDIVVKAIIDKNKGDKNE